MFAIGNVFIGKYKVWITTPVFSLHPWDSKSQDLPYFGVMVSKIYCEKPDKVYCPVDLSTSEEFKEILSLTPQKRSTDKTDLISYEAFLQTKDQSAPVWKLSKNNVEKIFEICQMLEKPQDNL